MSTAYTSVKGKRVLVVEDEFFIAAMAEDMLLELGAHPLGPSSNASEALALIGTESIDAVMLDVNLSGARSDAVAAELTKHGVPHLIVSGYGAGLVGFDGAPRLDKPYTLESLGEALERLFAAK